MILGLRSLCTIIVLTFAVTTSAQEDVYSYYFDKAQKQAKKLTSLYYGAENSMVSFEPGPAGTFVVMLQNITTKEISTLYLLSDLEHLVEGRLLSTLIRDKASAHGIKSLENMAIQNKQLDQTVYSLRAKITGGLQQKSAASLLSDGFSNIENTEQAPDYAISNEPVSSSNEVLYNSLSKLHFIQQGTGQNVMYIFVDHNCPACIKMHKYLDEYNLPINVAIRYIPVAIVNDDSEAKAVYSLVPEKNESRLVSMQYMMDARPLNQLTDHVPEKTQLDDAFLRYRENTLNFFKMPTPATPYIGMKINGVVTLRPLADPASFDTAIAALSKVDLLTGQPSSNGMANE